MKRKYWIIGITIVLVVAGALAIRGLASGRAQTTQSLQTATVTRGAISATLSGAGTVRSKQSAVVNWQTSGKVGTVTVAMGQQVEAGDPLASIDPSSLSTSIIQAQSDLISAQKDLEDLKKPQPLKIAQAELALEEAKDALNDLLLPSESATSQAELALIEAQETLDDAQKAVDRLNYARASEELLSSARAAYLLAQDKVDQMQDKYEETPGTPEEDAVKALALSNLAASKTERDRALANLNWYLGTPNETEIAEKHMNLALAQGQLADAQEALDKIKNPSAADIALAQAMVEEAQETFEAAQTGASEEELTVAQTRVTLAEAALNQATLTAPFSGTITDIQVIAGDIVTQGKEAFQIDNFSTMFVDLVVSEVDISQVQVGQQATLMFDAISGKEYNGKVTKAGVVAMVSQGVVNYPVTVQITDPDESIRPGMTAVVTIVVEEHEDVLIVPNQAIRTGSGQRMVTVLFEGQQISVPVTVGLTNETISEVASNQLREGDELILNSSISTSTSSQTQREFFQGGVPGGLGGPGVVFP